ncbi:plasminogen-binding N-terminal domain-containing protein [Nautilia sp. PV-1]|uniref:plasminogen-binding N-terminal domain-containing protein n=1 Tax=Nautilia sp. PV-1 TaxID=2579250 RepID=UPI0014397EB7|nr:plasminogen-binding N-terminal domain-containing protein [Nautilia sp. PV-1]
MRWFVFLIFAVLLNAYDVTITNVNSDVATLDKYVKKGVSGVVLCPYNGKNIICARAVCYGKKAKLLVYKELKNDAFALPVVLPKKGDKILLAKDYDRILIIAPNQLEYLKMKEKYKNATVISSDNFAAFLEGIPSRENFINFAKKLNIGRIIFVLDKIYEVDANSFYAVKKYGSINAKYKEIFFTTYPKFDIKGKNIIAYYKSLIKE